MNITLKVWRQKGPNTLGAMETHEMSNISGDMSFLEMIDVLNDNLVREGKEPIARSHEGIQMNVLVNHHQMCRDFGISPM